MARRIEEVSDLLDGDSLFGRFTDDQLVGAIAKALKAGDIEAVETITLVLAGQNPKRAQEVFDTMQLGLLISRRNV